MYLLPVPPPGVLSRNNTCSVVSNANVYGDVVAVDTAAPFITHVSNAYGEFPEALNTNDTVLDTLKDAE